MGLMRLVLNGIWFVFGGFFLALGWWFAAVIMVLTIVGIPWARSAVMMGRFMLWPFGYEAVSRKTLTGQKDLGTGALGCVGNAIWFVLAGWWLAIGHLLSAIFCALTIVGIPFAWKHLMMIEISLMPVGKSIVSVNRTGQ